MGNVYKSGAQALRLGFGAGRTLKDEIEEAEALARNPLAAAHVTARSSRIAERVCPARPALVTRERAGTTTTRPAASPPAPAASGRATRRGPDQPAGVRTRTQPQPGGTRTTTAAKPATPATRKSSKAHGATASEDVARDHRPLSDQQRRRDAAKARAATKTRAEPPDISIDANLASIYGCCGLFDLCGDSDLMSLTFAGADPFMDWIGWSPSDTCIIKRYFLTFVRPEQSGGAPTPGWVSDPCGEANGAEFGFCDFELRDFARLRREGPARDMTEEELRLCEAQPRYRVDGSLITRDSEFDSVIATEALLEDVSSLIITGNKQTAGQFDGLERLVRNGYRDTEGRRCQSMDSIVIDWNGNDFDGGSGITWNGAAVADTVNFVDVMIEGIRRVRQRISWSRVLRRQKRGPQDAILMLPTFLGLCLLDAYTCWSVCPGVQFNEANINTLEGRAFRDNLNGGAFGNGRIFVDGQEVPLLFYDWETIKSDTTGDIYYLTGQVGSIKLLQGQYLNMNNVPNPQRPGYWVTDGGRLLHWNETRATCEVQTLEFRPRLLSWAPWTNIRWQDVSCETIAGPMSPDPSSSWYIQSSFCVARNPC